MAQISSVFVSKIYRAELAAGRSSRLVPDLERAARTIAGDDTAGQACRANDDPGYTSYASLNDLTSRKRISVGFNYRWA